MERGAWQATIHGVMKSQTWLSNYHFLFRLYMIKLMGGDGGKDCVPPQFLPLPPLLSFYQVRMFHCFHLV